jgi:hypothetical protein
MLPSPFRRQLSPEEERMTDRTNAATWRQALWALETEIARGNHCALATVCARYPAIAEEFATVFRIAFAQVCETLEAQLVRELLAEDSHLPHTWRALQALIKRTEEDGAALARWRRSTLN